MIKAIIFDCFGVLANDVWLAFLDTLPEGADVEQAGALNRAYDAGILSKEEFESGMIDAVGAVPFLLEDAKPGQMVKNTALLELIQTLRPKYKIGILSNIYSDWVRENFLSKDEQELFDDMAFSFEIGRVKPEPEMFRIACERLGVLPEEAVMIDDRESNVLAAQDVGMQGLVYSDMRSFTKQLQNLLDTNN